MRSQALNLVVGLGLLAGANLAFGETLLDAYRQAQQSDPQLKAAEQAHLAALQAKPLSRAGLLPQLSANANIQRNEQDVTKNKSPFPATNTSYNSNGYTLSLTQPIYHHDTWVRYSQADSQIAQADATYQAAKQDLIVRVSNAYFTLLAAEDSLRFAQAEKTAIAHQLQQTKQRFDVGLTAITDVHEAQARYDLSVTQEIAARNQVATAQEALREILGQAPGNLAPLSTELPLITPSPDNIDSWVKTATEQNLQLLAAEASVESARQEVSARRAGHYPTLDLVASRSHSDTTDYQYGSERNDTVVGLQLNLPIFSGGSVSASTQQASYLYNEAQDKLEQQRRATVRQTRDAFLSVMTGISKVEALKQSVVSAKTALKATEAGFEVGTRTAVEVLNSQQQVFGAERDYAQSRYDYIMSTLRLKQAAGTLSEADLQTINQWFK